jgi:ABC-type lipoprotein export system ATPase subunit
MVVKLLQRAVEENGTTIVAASHDPDVIAAADERLTLTSGATSLRGHASRFDRRSSDPPGR